MAFASLEHRMAQTYMDSFPQFIPDEEAPVSISEQEFFYTFIMKLYQLGFDNPLLFVPSLHEDDAYPNRFNKSSYGKPDLQKNMKKFTLAMDTLLHKLFAIGHGSSVKLNKREKEILTTLGIGDFTVLPPAWVWMSTRPDSSLIAFSNCFFKNDYPYVSDIYARLLGCTAFRKLEDWMKSQGYRKYDMDKTTAGECKISLTYANPQWSQENPHSGFEYKIRHTGISARYEPFVKHPAVFGLCIPNGLKTFLEAFDSMSKGLQEFVVSCTKKCNGCRYCVQTDKTGLRPFAFIKVNNEGKDYCLCPYFPGCNYCWSSIDDILADQLIEMLSFMDRFAPINHRQKKMPKEEINS